MKPCLLDPDDTILILIDIQENLWNVMYNRGEIEGNAGILTDLAIKTEMPIVLTTQYKRGIGPTIKSLNERLIDLDEIEKLCFNCFDTDQFRDRVFSTGRKTLLIAGIEAHICVLQTALRAIEQGFTVHVVADATGSRTVKNHKIGLGRMRDAGCVITSTEAAAFEVIREAGTPLFKDMLKLIR
jgi:nicotinamidase-related amidase